MFSCLALLVGPTVTLKANLCHFLFFLFLHVFPTKFLPVRPPHSVCPSCQFVFPSPSRPAPAEERGGFVPPTLARDEWNPGPEEAGAGGPPHPRPHEGRQAAHHGQIGLGQRVSRGRGSLLFKHAIAMMAQGSFTVFGRFHLRGSCPWILVCIFPRSSEFEDEFSCPTLNGSFALTWERWSIPGNMLSALHFVRVVIVRHICDSEAPAESQIDAREEVDNFLWKTNKRVPFVVVESKLEKCLLFEVKQHWLFHAQSVRQCKIKLGLVSIA